MQIECLKFWSLWRKRFCQNCFLPEILKCGKVCTLITKSHLLKDCGINSALFGLIYIRFTHVRKARRYFTRTRGLRLCMCFPELTRLRLVAPYGVRSRGLR